jgi:hypothetical protein
MNSVYSKEWEKYISLEFLKSKGFTESQIVEIGMELKNNKQKFINMYNQQIVDAIIIYNKKSILLRINTAIDTFFGYIEFLFLKFISNFKRKIK